MGFQFRGAFALDAPGLLEAATQKWPDARVKRVSIYFYGVGIRFGDDYGYDVEHVADFRDELPVWSAEFEDTPIVFLSVDCFGGVCENEGFVVCNGVLIRQESDEGALSRLVAALGVPLNDSEEFAPLHRGFWLGK